jgi:hypothetical protein
MRSLKHRGLARSLGYVEGSDCLEGFAITDSGRSVLENPEYTIPPPPGAEIAGEGPPSLFGGYEQAMRSTPGGVDVEGGRRRGSLEGTPRDRSAA